MIPESLPKVFLRRKMGHACALSNPSVLIERFLVPKMRPRDDFDKATLLTNFDFLDFGS